MTEARDIIEALGLVPHPEGGWYRETWRGKRGSDGRAVGTAIYYLLEEGQISRWHRVDAAEIWHYYAGAPLALSIERTDGIETLKLGLDLTAGERPQAIVPAETWQSAESLGAWTLVGCTVSPGFEFGGFELAPEDWTRTK